MNEIFEKMKMIGEDLYSHDLIDSHGGSISIRIEDKIYINTKGCMLGHLKQEDIMEVGMESAESDKQASRELNTHRAIYKETGYKAIIHAHPINAIVLSMKESKIIPQDSKGSFFIKSVPIVRVREKISSDDVARMLPPIYKSDYVIAIVKDYGSFAVGQDLDEALKYTTCLEQSCKILVCNKLMEKEAQQSEMPRRPRTAIPPSLGVMDRSRERSRERDRGRGGFRR